MSVASSSSLSSTTTPRTMIKEPPNLDRISIVATTSKTHNSRLKLNRNISSKSLYSPKLSVYILVSCGLLFIIFQIRSLHNTLPPSPSPSSPPFPSYNLMYHIQKYINRTLSSSTNCTKYTESVSTKLRQSVTFLPLKDLRYSSTAQEGHTWFMSSMYDTHEEGEVQYQEFPSPSSKGRLLCLMGNDTHDGSNNYYALAWPETLPERSFLMRGLTFVSYNHYIYDNIWHGLSAMVPFVAWHKKNHCELPSRWVLYHWGELRMEMSSWLNNLMGATFNRSTKVEAFDRDDQPVCFEKAVVMRHNEGGMSRVRRMEVYDLLRCKAKLFCNLSLDGRINEVDDKGLAVIRMTMFMRTGARSFKNETAVIGIFESECAKVDGCKLTVAYSNNLSFCEQVKLMGSTDILISPHGAQLTNMFLMDRNSTVMEFFPKGWLKLAGVGQYVYHWMASWSGMRHRGAWRDPEGETCPYPEDDRRCMSVYKDGRIGHNETFFREWAKIVLDEVKMRKIEELQNKSISYNGYGNTCSC